MPPVDYSWSETACFLCRCGTMYSARRWRWIDADVRPSLLERVRTTGPWDGSCPVCGQDATGHGGWVCVQPRNKKALLVLDPSRRGDLIDELRAHLDRVQSREAVPTWLLSPWPQFVSLEEAPRRDETTARRSYQSVLAESQAEADAAQTTVRRDISGPAASASSSASPDFDPILDLGPSESQVRLIKAAAEEMSVEDLDEEHELPLPVEPTDSLAATLPPPSVDDPDAGVPQLIGADSPPPALTAPRPESIGAHVADLTLDGTVTFRVRVSLEERTQWESARLSVRPIHLRGRGYPLVGVRVVGSYMGQVGCIDAVVDVGSTLATDVFRRLSEKFEVTVLFEGGSRELQRTIEAEGLEPNAALCIESARGILARGEYPPQEFDRARQALESEPAEVRLAPPDVTISSGAYQHIIGAREAVAALEQLERVSQKETLARILEVDGLPMAEYDMIRRRVLEGSLVHGLCAPRRFWRRLVASGLARDLTDYAQRLSANRAEYEGEEGDLDAEEARAAWMAIHELCRRKDIEPPPQLRRALDLPEPRPASPSKPRPAPSVSRPTPPSVGRSRPTSQPELIASPPPLPRRGAAATSGEIRSGEINVGGTPPPSPANPGGPLGNRLRDPSQRLRAATEVLQGRGTPEDLSQVLDALEEFESDELLALLPDLNDLGVRAVPGLIAKLKSERREVRQAAAILLGMSREPDAMQQLSEHLVWEPTTVWLDVARALGWFGTAAIRSLCQLLRAEAASPREQLTIDRVSRALAEVAVAQDSGNETQTGRDAVQALADAADPRVSTAARRALANLAEVTTSGAQIRGEIPLNEVTEIRAFARSAYEAIMVPELEVEAEA